MSAEPSALSALQHWMLRVVSHPEGAEAGLGAATAEGLMPDRANSLEQVVPGNDRLSPTQQLDIYAFMYFARLVEILELEYPTVRFLVGPKLFDELARGYLGAHPSSHYSLGQLSARFPSFLRNEAPDLPHRAFAFCLAQVERAMEDVTDDPSDEPLASESLSSIPQDRWASARLQPIRAMRLLELTHPTSEFMNAVQQDRYASVPAPETTFVCVYRTGNTVYRRPIEPLRHRLLARLVEGDSLGEAIEGIATDKDGDPSVLVDSLAGWFEDWAEDRIFTAIDLDDA